MTSRPRLHETTLGKEMLQQSAVLGRTLQSQRTQVQVVAETIMRMDTRSIDVVAIGSSKNAALVARHLLRKQIALNVQEPTDFVPSSTVLFLVSQSGESKELKDLAEALPKGQLVVTITNTPGSTLDTVADAHIYTYAGKEQSIAATGSMTSIVLSLYHVGAYLHTAPLHFRSDIEVIPANLRNFLIGLPNLPVGGVIESIQNLAYLVVLGRGLMGGVAAEVALKIGETAEIATTYEDLGIFRHGYVAPFGARTEPVLSLKKGLLILSQPGDEQLVEYYQRLSAEKGFSVHTIPAVFSEHSFDNALFTIVLGQYLAHEIAISKGIEPGTSNVLCKVVSA